MWTGANYGGDAGNITVRANSINLLDKGNIYSNGFGYGRGGVIDIAAHDVLISAANEAAVTNLQTVSGVAAQTDNFSNGGLIKLQADNLKILDGGQISTVLLGGGRGADADIQAKNILISGYVLDPILGYSLSGIDARLAVITHLDGSLSTPTGVGGNINVTTDNLQITNGGAVRTNLFDGASGTAGDINISAGGINISSGGQIYADSFRGTGDSGNINITANTLGIAGFGNSQAPFPIPEFTGLSTTTNAGRGGTINLSLTGDLSVDSGGGINAETQGSGLGGAISIAAQNINLTNGSSISAASYGTGNAGNIDFKVGNTFTARNSTVSTQAVESDGGDIVLTAGYMARLIDSKITTSVNGGPQTVGGNITVDPDFVILQGSSIVANAFQGKGGNIRIAADTYLADPVSVVSASSALGIDGTVDISAPISDISAVVQPLPKEFVSATELLREPCEVRARGGKSSSLVLKGRDGVPNEPGGFLPSPMN
ncbi:hypothetical protein SBDP1_760079 [Syntrophobacter sp. SbD1]|nr:hypothetical protein SBDP1_760079 [Syntrophobacter sp. SbD1]